MSFLPGTVLLVRHAKATGQEPDAPLTLEGVGQAQRLAHDFTRTPITRIVSSPWRRAVATIQPTADRLGKPVLTDERLTERILSPHDLPDWRSALQASFAAPHLKLPGGESGAEAKARALAALNEHRDPAGITVVVTHGNLLALLLDLDFDSWHSLRNPDVWVSEPEVRPKRWER